MRDIWWEFSAFSRRVSFHAIPEGEYQTGIRGHWGLEIGLSVTTPIEFYPSGCFKFAWVWDFRIWIGKNANAGWFIPHEPGMSDTIGELLYARGPVEISLYRDFEDFEDDEG